MLLMAGEKILAFWFFIRPCKNLVSRDKYGLKISYIILFVCSCAPHEGAQESGCTNLLILTFTFHKRWSGSGQGCLLYIYIYIERERERDRERERSPNHITP
jgi:hypothetical protein